MDDKEVFNRYEFGEQIVSETDNLTNRLNNAFSVLNGVESIAIPDKLYDIEVNLIKGDPIFAIGFYEIGSSFLKISEESIDCFIPIHNIQDFKIKAAKEKNKEENNE